MTKVDSETAKKIHELQALEQNLQAMLMQKQNLQVESNEVNNALTELKDYKGESYRILSGIMIKESPEKLRKEMEDRKKHLDSHISAIEKQEKSFFEKVTAIKKEISGIVSK